MQIKAADVKALREKTGAGMMECKKALEKYNGDAVAAEEYLKERGLAAVEQRAERATPEGLIVIKQKDSVVAMVELNCETDFVSKNADFIALGNTLVDTILEKGYTKIEPELTDMALALATRIRENMSLSRIAVIQVGSDEYAAHYVHSDKKTGVTVLLKSDKPEVFQNEDIKAFAFDCCLQGAAYLPPFVSRADVPQSHIDEKTAEFTQEVAEIDKPEKVKEGIIKGKLNKYLSGISMLDQAFVKEESLTVSQKMKALAKQVDAQLSISSLTIFNLGGK